MRFELFVIGVLLCATLRVCDAKWCVKNKETQVLTYKPVEDSEGSSAGFMTESVPTTKQIWVCCEGYQLAGKNCVPVCKDGCPEAQKCIEPEVCGCDKGHSLKDDTCQPDCESSCKNGVCEDDECVCNEGYQKSDESGECQSTCDLDCGPNAHCSGNGDCACDAGFFRNELNICQSWCKTPCKNGDCVGPNNCTCHEGFVSVDGMCIRDCKSGCMFGDCLPSSVCVCWPGYIYNPDTRNCQEGTVVTTAEPKRSMLWRQPEERCPDYCPNGECIDGTCKCGKGLLRVDLLCARHCENCQFGECVEESVCRHQDRLSAAESTSTSPSTSSSAEPLETATCATGCWAGTCVNGVCQCTEGLVLNGENECVRPCEEHCKNGLCGEDNACLCSVGHILKDGIECVPVCNKGCENGFCISPDRCECHEGYLHSLGADQEHICMPTCDGLEGNEGCINGTCVGVNKCQCLEGLIFNPDNRFECIPYPVDVTEGRHKRSWYMYLLLGILIVLLMIILLLLAIRKFHQDSYNVEKVEKHRASVQYHSV